MKVLFPLGLLISFSWAQNVGIGTSNPVSRLHVAGTNPTLTVGPFGVGEATGRIVATGATAELSFVRRSLATWPPIPAPGDRFVWYSPDGTARLWTEGRGDLVTVTAHPRIGIAITTPEGVIHATQGAQDPQVDATNWALPYGSEKADLILTRQHSANRSLNGYIGPLIDLRTTNSGGDNWSVAQIIGVVDLNVSGGWAGGLAFLTSPGGNTDPPGERNRGTGPTARMVIDANGNVGVNTLNPVSKFQVVHRTRWNDVFGPSVLPGITVYDNTDFVGIATMDRDNNLSTIDDADGILYWGDNLGGENFHIVFMEWAGTQLVPRPRMTITSHGWVNIGTTTPEYGVYLNVRKPAYWGAGNGQSNDAPTTAIITGGANGRYNDWPNGWAGGLSTWDIVGASCYFLNYITRSDKRYKRAITPLEGRDIQQRFMQLRPVSYYLDTTRIKVDDPDRLRFGFIANEVEALFPNLVVNAGLSPEVPRGLEYDGFIPLLVKMVQEQQKAIEALQAENHSLREKYEELRARLETHK
ncbi:MAG: tail fiber domain-containing protein [Bacteroidia bacterium]